MSSPTTLDHPIQQILDTASKQQPLPPSRMPTALRELPEPGIEARNCGNLAKALSEARDRCKTAHKDSRNEYHKYDYASSEAVLQAAAEALHGSGLAILPVRSWMTAIDSSLFLQRQFLVAHVSGECMPLELRDWPVIPERGRPLDKAYAGALTTSLAYFLRDLLGMPRVDPEDDVAGREDREPEQQPAKKPRRPLSGWIARADKRLAELNLATPGSLTAHLRSLFAREVGDDIATWPEQARPRIVQATTEYHHWCAQNLAKASAQAIARLQAELKRTGQSWESAFDFAELKGSKARSENLTGEMIERVLEQLAPLDDAPKK